MYFASSLNGNIANFLFDFLAPCYRSGIPKKEIGRKNFDSFSFVKRLYPLSAYVMSRIVQY